MKISELNEDQKGHLVWLLDKHTHVGLLSAGSIARGEFGDIELIDVFLKAEMSQKVSEKLAKQVEKFVVNETDRQIAMMTMQLMSHCHFTIRNSDFDEKEKHKIYSELSKFLKDFADLMEEPEPKKKKKKAKA